MGKFGRFSTENYLTPEEKIARARAGQARLTASHKRQAEKRRLQACCNFGLCTKQAVALSPAGQPVCADHLTKP